jgi:hypothetical protein
MEWVEGLDPLAVPVVIGLDPAKKAWGECGW